MPEPEPKPATTVPCPRCGGTSKLRMIRKGMIGMIDAAIYDCSACTWGFEQALPRPAE